MKRALLIFFLVLAGGGSVMSQNLTEAEVSAIMTKAFEQNKAGNYSEALEGFLTVGESTRQQRNETERKVYVCSQTMAVMCYESLHQYQEGFLLCDVLLKGRVTASEKKDLMRLYVMNGYLLATSYMHKDSRRYADARDVFAKILPMASDEMKKLIIPKIPLAWYFEGTVYQMQQKYEEAITCLLEAIKGFRSNNDLKNEIDALFQVGEIKTAMFDIYGALEFYRQAETQARIGGFEDKLLGLLKEQQQLSSLIGDYESAYRLSLQMDSLVAVTDNNDVKVAYYNNKGDEAKAQGLYDLSEQWYLKNDEYIKQLNNEYIGADKYLHYNKLRDLYTKSGRYDEALRYAKLCIYEFQRKRAMNDEEYYLPYRGMVEIYRKAGDSVRCFQYLDTLFLSLGRCTEPREIHYLYITRAMCYSSFKNYEQALADYKTADSLLATRYSENDGDRIELLPLMGALENKLGHYSESECLYRKHFDWKRIHRGEDGNEYIDALYYLANAEGFAGHIEAACNDYATAVDEIKKQTRYRLPYMTTAERESYWTSITQMVQGMTPFALKSEQYQSKFTKDSYEALVLLKAFLLETERSSYELIKKNGGDDDLHDYAAIAAMRAQIRKWERDYVQNVDSILFVTSKADAIEKRLTGRCREYGDMTSFMEVGYQKIKDNLRDGDVLIDFTDFESESRGRLYAAYVVDNKQEYPFLKLLFAESAIDSMNVTHPDWYYQNPYSETMCRLLWDPFKNHVREGSTVYYVPSQILFKMALESIPLKDGTLLGDHYHFVRLSSAREIVRVDSVLHLDVASADTHVVLYGGLQYDMDTNAMAEEAQKYDISPLLVMRGDNHKRDSVFGKLPGSMKEIAAIERILKTHQIRFSSYSEARGSEESFLSMSGHSPQVLHITTHGFFYSPTEAQGIDYLRGYKDAMLLSGLVMSGGNAAWRGRSLPKGVLDGILTASNIALLDLENTQLAVLAACQSGQGEATSEGLYGLQRAFKKAGVKTIIMSLWNVSDVVGAEFMKRFYENLTEKENHWNKRTAFEKTKSSIRKDYTQPYYWAGFVMLD